MLVMSVLSDSFLDCLSAVEYFQEESLCVLPRSRCKVKPEGECRDEVRTRASLTLLQDKAGTGLTNSPTFMMEVRSVEDFSMAQGWYAMVSRCSLPEVPPAYFVRPRPQRRSGKTPTSLVRKTCADLPVGQLRASGGLHGRRRLALSKATGQARWNREEGKRQKRKARRPSLRSGVKAAASEWRRMKNELWFAARLIIRIATQNSTANRKLMQDCQHEIRWAEHLERRALYC